MNVTGSGTEAAAIAAVGLPRGVSVGTISASPGELATLTFAADTTATPGGPFEITVRATRGAESDEIAVSLLIAGAVGTPVASFGENGRVTVPLELRGKHVVARHGDGWIVAGSALGSPPRGAPILRYTSEGALDVSFGHQGYADDTSSSPLIEVYSVAVRAERIVALGATTPHTQPGSLRYVRGFTAEGQTDITFGSEGSTFLEEIFEVSNATRSGRLIPTADAFYGATGNAVFRLRPSGRIDPSFGMGGFLRGAQTEWHFVPLISRGEKVYIVRADSTYNFRLNALTPEGEYETSFGENGSVELGTITSAEPWDDRGRLVICQYPGSSQSFVRVLEDGSLDRTFGVEGTVTIPRRYDFVNQTHPLNDGSMLAISFDGFVQRWRDDGSLDEGYVNGGEFALGASNLRPVVVDEERGILTFLGLTAGASTVVLGQVWL